MSARFCMVEEKSEDAARKAGASELGVPPEDVAVEELEGDRFRVAVVRAPATIEVAVVKDDMEAVVTRIAPSLGDYPEPTRETVEEALREIGVTVGLLLDEIDELLEAVAKSGLERHEVTVARGLLPRPGADAKITRLYLPDDEGDLDRRQLIVRDGQLLVEKEPATSGEPGRTVKGETVPAVAGRGVRVPRGDGVVADEDGLRWSAAVPGFGYLEIDGADGPRVVPAVTVSEDRLSAYLDLRPPGADEAPITRGEVDAAIRSAGLVHGLSLERIERAWETFEREGALPSPALIAEGDPPRPGRDAGIDLEIGVGQLVGEVDETGTQIDFRERRMIKNVCPGQRIGTWYTDTDGVPGRGVDGAELPAAHGAPGTYATRENVVSSELEDGNVSFEATIEGMLLVSDKNELSVVNVLEIPGDVDYDTGNIDADGCLVVRGTVRSMFRVTAAHDITVLGSIEDAIVDAGGVVEVGAGILGGENGHVSAGSHVSTRFAQNANITCEGDVEIRESETNSVIECRGRLLATGPRGKLRGGRFTAARGLKAQELGSELGTPTTVSVGADAELIRALRDVRAELRAIQEKGRKLRRSVGGGPTSQITTCRRPEQMLAVRRHIKAKREQITSEAAIKARLRRLQAELSRGEPPTVAVVGTVHAGVDIYICGAHLHTDEAVEHVRYHYDAESGEIQKGAL